MTTPGEAPRSRFAPFVRGYKAVGAILLTAVVFFLVINLLSSVILRVTGKPKDPTGWKMVPAALLPRVFPDLDAAQCDQLIRELREFKLGFLPFAGFRCQDTSGSLLNVRNGIRSLGKGRDIVWPPRKDETVVFVFGGSTTFGYCADHQTIPAYLQDALRPVGENIRVYNFGCPFYYSTQERILFEQLLQAGHVPRVAVFIDGLNETGHTDVELMGTDRFQRVFDEKARWPAPPVVRLVQRMTGADRPPPPPPASSFGPDVLARIVDRYLANKKMIEATARAYGVAPVFVLQPSPTYKLESELYPYKEDELGRYVCAKLAYPVMADRFARTPMGDDFLWLAELQVGFKEPVYADQCHYSAPFSKALAGAIAQFLADRKILPGSAPK